MLRSILVPLDGTSFSERSLPLARQMARASGGEIHLVRVHLPREPDALLSHSSFQWEGVDLSEYDQKERRTEADYLERLEHALGSNGIHVDSALLEAGDVSEQLREHAERVDADTIVITSHAREGVQRLFLGSVADKVLRTSRLPLFIVHPERGERDVVPPTKIEHILVPVDWSGLVGAVFAPLIELAKTMGARVTLTSVVTPVVVGPKIVPIAPETPDEDEERARAHLEEMAGDLRAEGLDVDVLVVSANDPERGIVSVAEACGADLIAMATHGYTGVKRKLAGSIANRVLHMSDLPMMVMRPPAEA